MTDLAQMAREIVGQVCAGRLISPHMMVEAITKALAAVREAERDKAVVALAKDVDQIILARTVLEDTIKQRDKLTADLARVTQERDKWMEKCVESRSLADSLIAVKNKALAERDRLTAELADQRAYWNLDIDENRRLKAIVEKCVEVIISSHPQSKLFREQLQSGELGRRLNMIGADIFDPQHRARTVLKAQAALTPTPTRGGYDSESQQ